MTICKDCVHIMPGPVGSIGESFVWAKCKANPKTTTNFVSGEQKVFHRFCDNKNNGNCPDFEEKPK